MAFLFREQHKNLFLIEFHLFGQSGQVLELSFIPQSFPEDDSGTHAIYITFKIKNMYLDTFLLNIIVDSGICPDVQHAGKYFIPYSDLDSINPIARNKLMAVNGNDVGSWKSNGPSYLSSFSHGTS